LWEPGRDREALQKAGFEVVQERGARVWIEFTERVIARMAQGARGLGYTADGEKTPIMNQSWP